MSYSLISRGLPQPEGLYDPRNEHDACGIGFVANVSGEKSHDIILKGKIGRASCRERVFGYV